LSSLTAFEALHNPPKTIVPNFSIKLNTRKHKITGQIKMGMKRAKGLANGQEYFKLLKQMHPSAQLHLLHENIKPRKKKERERGSLRAENRKKNHT